MLFAAALGCTLAAVAAPGLRAGLDESRAAGAARYLATRLQRARIEAAMRSSDVGFRLVPTAGGSYTYSVYVDGNRNGIRSADISRGIDRELMPAERLPDLFPGVDFGVLPGLPAVDPGGTPPGTDPIKLGAGNILTFSPAGTATPGSLYLLARNGSQYVIRVLGQTGRTRVLKFDSRRWEWDPL